MGISAKRLSQLAGLIAAGREGEFYNWQEWRSLRPEVLKLDKEECQICKEKRHKYRKATIVHHVKHLRDRPDLALSIWDPDTQQRQLISVCKKCHEEEHPESQRQYRKILAPITQERWD